MSRAIRSLRIGTRGSALARWQAEHVAEALARIPGLPHPELVLIKTEGDRIQDVPLSQVPGKAFFTKEIESALLEDEVDLAVHSLKDLATRMPPGLTLGAVLEREDPRDALLLAPPRGTALTPGDTLHSFAAEGQSPAEAGPACSPDLLPLGARVGTSSLRRRALMARWRPDVELAELRGNVPTRIGKLDEGAYDAIILAAAGVKRLGLVDRITAFLPFDSFLPAVSQGAIGIQIRADDEEVADWIGALEHIPTRAATTAERALLRTLEGGCQVPVGAFAELVDTGADQPGDGGSAPELLPGRRLDLRAVVCSLDGARSVEGHVSGSPDDAEGLGVGLAEELLSRGGGDILEEVRKGAGET